MAALLRKRKGKVVAQSSSEVPRFKTPFHEAHFKGKLSARKVLSELVIEVNDEIISPCAMQIKMRKWEKFTNPLQAVGHNMVKEFYANAWEPDKDKKKPYTYKTMVQGKDISFAPKDLKRVLKLRKDPLPNVGSYLERKASKDYRLEEVQECLCLEGREWIRHRDRRPHYLRRNDLDPMAKALCLDAKVTTLKDDTLIPQELPIVGEAMVRVREPRARNQRANQARQEAPQQ
ncbi:hypothetical protein PIB30_052331 [Stylosanthes scabra]|uniref:Putative plant transposon protein domain-containing protein n=1 Tax=Stylosanthes scabra TaxID=79078 RepID=A0ABU6XIG0_9FABA|nr:hypothetical protein [Stylosanthes scabra]